MIDSVEKKDAGEYICEAGTEKLSFKMHVEGKEKVACLTNNTLPLSNSSGCCYLLVYFEGHLDSYKCEN